MNTDLVVKKGGDGKHYIHLAAKGAPTIDACVDFAEQASAALQLYRDTYGLGNSDLKPGAGEIFNPEGDVVGHVSYNGRVWAGTAREWKQGTKLLQEAYQ